MRRAQQQSQIRRGHIHIELSEIGNGAEIVHLRSCGLPIQHLKVFELQQLTQRCEADQRIHTAEVKRE